MSDEAAIVFLVLGAGVFLAMNIAVGTIAAGKGRSAVGWFFASLLFTPVITLLMLIAAGPADTDDRRQAAPRESAAERRQARRAGA